jgi:hypothetical protein
MAMKEPIDIEDLRKRHANSIRNTATGRALGQALDELEELKNLNERKNDADDGRKRTSQ